MLRVSCTSQMSYCRQLPWATVLVGSLWLSAMAHAEDRFVFNRDIRPILSEYCWKCHGFDASSRQAGLRLDQREAAIVPTASGKTAIIPGHPERSELIARLTTDDTTLQMPPASSNKRPTADEIERVKQWIVEGAPYQRHWSFEPLVRPAIPDIREAHHPIDAFVVKTLQSRQLTLSPTAERDTLIRRVYFDLIGLPPSLEQLDLARQETWEQTVDRLLASPHFGERMAVDWLDAARYADTDGYFGDKPRQVWLWRDWVIDAFNRNLPFDQFTLEQLAGDLLPDATISQRIATGFNRNHMSNDETGLIDEEYRVEYVADRLDTTMSTWLGLTVGCARCHDHKYDPITQREYYQLFAFFNNVPERGLLVGQNAPPRISVPSAAQSLHLMQREVATAAATRTFEPLRANAVADLAARESELRQSLARAPNGGHAIHLSFADPLESELRVVGTTPKHTAGVYSDGLHFDATQHLECDAGDFPIDGPWTLGFWMTPEKSLGCPISKIEPAGDRRGLEVLWRKGRIIVNLVHRWNVSRIELSSREKLATDGWQHVVVRYDGSGRAEGLQLFFNGRRIETDVLRDSLTGTIANGEPIRIARRDDGLGFYGSLDEIHWVDKTISDAEIRSWSREERLHGILDRPTGQRSVRDNAWLLDDYIDHQSNETTRLARDAVRAAQSAEETLRASIPTALVMEEQATVRPTHVLNRGVYDQPGEPVSPGTPAALSPWLAEAPRNRLGLARWLIAPDNPLVARVAVNRLWQMCFGEGLVRTLGDFGAQGEPPTHPELLDYLAVTYRDSGWDTKALLKLIVTSQTYRQRSQGVATNRDVFDPENRLLARGPRFRLAQEMIRDQALVVSGLMIPDIGGPSVKPYQPPGLWEAVSYDGESSYEVDQGEGRYRRSLYTFHKRQSPPPGLMVFDGPTREKCTLKRARTNTPLQALIVLNDETFVEAARELAASLLRQPKTDQERIRQVIRTILSREATSTEESRLMQFLANTRERYAATPVAARELVGAVTADPIELAAWTIVVHTLFNLDEAIVRR